MQRNSFMRRNFGIAAALMLSLTPALAQSQAPVPQQQQGGGAGAVGPARPEIKAAREAMRQACMEDVRSLCAGSEPGRGKVMMCLRSHKGQVSEGCKTAAQHLREARRGA